MADPTIPGWLTGLLTAVGAGLGAAARSIVSRWRNRKHDDAAAQLDEATAADTLVSTALKLLEQVQQELATLKVQLAQCRDERRLQEEVIVGLRLLIDGLTRERDSLRELLEQATRPH